jgi:hypothetical protein
MTGLVGAIIHVNFGHDVDSYFDIPMPRSLNEWQKECFYLRNDDATPLPVFTGNRLVPQPNWGMGWSRGTLASYSSCARSSNSYDRMG